MSMASVVCSQIEVVGCKVKNYINFLENCTTFELSLGQDLAPLKP
jgi:hypothetical protein